MLLAERNIVVTGASLGLGKSIAQRCVAEGANVFLCARSPRELEQARDEVRAMANPKQVVEALVLDVSDAAAVQRFAKTMFERVAVVHGLVNNAGIYGPMGPSEDVDWDEWVRTIQINLLGSVQMCRAFVPHFRSRGYGKIVNMSGGGATQPQPRFSAYAASKAAIVRYSETIAEELRDAKIDVNCLAPGALNTRLLDEVLAAGPDRVGKDFYERSVKQQQSGGAGLERGSALCAYLLSARSDGITGRLISAIWDPWETLGDRRTELTASDIYTLRRIVPKDRGQDWGG